MNYQQSVDRIREVVLSEAILPLHVCCICNSNPESSQYSHTRKGKKATDVVSWVGLNDYHVNTWMDCKQSKLDGLLACGEKQSALETRRGCTLWSSKAPPHDIQDKLERRVRALLVERNLAGTVKAEE